jgi:hypothetical protein
VVSDERASPVPAFTPSIDATAPTHPSDGRGTPVDAPTASFDVGGFRIELTARSGAPTLDIIVSDARDTYVLDLETLDGWADGTARLLALSPAPRPGERADYRAPFLLDIEGRAALAFESVVTERGVAHRLLVMGQGGRVAALAASTETLTDLIAAARGTVSFGRAR